MWKTSAPKTGLLKKKCRTTGWKNSRTEVRVGSVLLYVHKNRRLIRDGAQDGHLDFHTAPEL